LLIFCVQSTMLASFQLRSIRCVLVNCVT